MVFKKILCNQSVGHGFTQFRREILLAASQTNLIVQYYWGTPDEI